jgi:hypothetical protein
MTIVAAIWMLAAMRTDPIAATIQNDCAPWDGAAFRVDVPAATLGVRAESAFVSVSVWKSPHIATRTTFHFADGTSAIPDSGAAVLWSKGGQAERLRGWVTFESVNGDAPVDGAFELTSKTGARFAASFHATWLTTRMFCG